MTVENRRVTAVAPIYFDGLRIVQKRKECGIATIGRCGWETGKESKRPWCRSRDFSMPALQ
jgi:hypothetical protein